MNYNDFQILSNEEYELINQHFSHTKKQDRKSLLNDICLIFLDCKNSCSHLTKKANPKLKAVLNNAHLIINKSFNNYASTFNLNISIKEIKDMSLFCFLRNLISAINLNTNWILEEEKEYYKNIGKKTNIELFNITKEILLSINESSFYFFQHM